MKKIFTLCAAMLISAMSFAQMPGDPNAIPGSMVLETATITGNGSVAENDGGVKRLDYCTVGTIVTFALNNATEQAYDVTYTQGTCMDGIMLDFEIVDANNDVVWTTQVPVVNTALKNNDTGVNFEIYETEKVGTTAVLPAGNYILNVYYNRDGVKGTYNGAEFDFTCNVSDITFTAVAGAGEGEGGGEGTAEGVVILSNTTLNKDASTNDSWSFNGTEVYLVPTGGRDVTKCGVLRENTEFGVTWGDGLNFRNNTTSTLILPQGLKVYRIEFNGYSQGDNWCYLYAYGPADGDWEWTDPIGTGVKDNTTIYEQAKYPLDPCWKTDINGGYSFSAPGYLFAAIDFANEPYEGAFAFQFSGNNQEQASIKLYTTRAAADAAATGIESAVVEKSEPSDARMYNIAGQMVTESYKGIVIKNGKKYLNK